MVLKALIVGILLGGAVLLLSLGLKNLPAGIIALVLEIIAALISPALAFILLPVLAVAVMVLPDIDISSLVPAGNEPVFCISAVSGPLAGRRYMVSRKSGPLSFGRENCKVLFPADTAGISRHHCTVKVQGEHAYLLDDDSNYGTFLLSPFRRLARSEAVPLAENSSFCLARKDIVFKINRVK